VATEIADALHLRRADVDARIDRILDALKPRVDPPSVSVAGPAGRTVGRWV
jgi:hypothetical protein